MDSPEAGSSGFCGLRRYQGQDVFATLKLPEGHCLLSLLSRGKGFPSNPMTRSRVSDVATEEGQRGTCPRPMEWGHRQIMGDFLQIYIGKPIQHQCCSS